MTGTLINKPVSRVANTTSRKFVTAQIRAADGSESFVVSVVAFHADVCAALLTLDKGDAVTITGSCHPTTWKNRHTNEQSVGMDVDAQQILTLYHLREKRKAIEATKENYLPSASPLAERGDDDGTAAC